MKKLFAISLLVLLCAAHGFGQTVFNEIFNDGNAATTGSDALGTSWATSCPHCGASNDWIEVDNAGDSDLETQDPNGPAYWETADFDISACTEGITISCDLSETGTMETITCGGNCNTGDGVKLEVSYDSGASWIAYSSAAPLGFPGTCAVMAECGLNDCTGGCTVGNYPVPWGAGDTLYGPFIAVDDFTSTSFSDCASVGIDNTMRFRFTFVSWAGSEIFHLDNVLAVCSNCALPVEIGHFTGLRMNNKTVLNWRTLSETNNKKFKIERSTDGVVFMEIGDTKGNFNSNHTIDYEFVDHNPPNRAVTYYRLVQVDMNGKQKFSKIITVEHEPSNIYFTGSELSVNFGSQENKEYTINIYDLSGKLIHSEISAGSTNIPWSSTGFYIVEIPEIELRHKIVVQ